MDNPRKNSQVHKVALFNQVVKEIKNLECYYEAKVQAVGSTIIPQNLRVNFGSLSDGLAGRACAELSRGPEFEAALVTFKC